MIMTKTPVLIITLTLASLPLHAANSDTVSVGTVNSMGMMISIAVFALAVVACVALLRKRVRRRRLQGLSHLL